MVRRKNVRLGIAGLLLIALVVAVTTPALAAPPASASPERNSQAVPGISQEELEEAFKLSRFLETNEDGTLSLDAEGARGAGVSEGIIQRVQKELERANKALRADKSFQALAASCGGYNYYEVIIPLVHERVFLDSCNTNRLIAYKSQIRDTVTLASIIMGMIPGGLPYALATAVAAYVLSTEINRLQAWNATGCGVYFNAWFRRITSGGPQYC